jgi:hypothetical protein
MPSVECYNASTRDKGRAARASQCDLDARACGNESQRLSSVERDDRFTSESSRSGGRIQVISYQSISWPVLQ